MMERIPFCSPAKENLPISPELINYLKTTSISLPSHIANYYHPIQNLL